ncbi:MAG: dienelactone hydrolase family protein, partial [bacterium]
MADDSRVPGRLQGKDLHPDVFRIFDRYVHGFIDRREFLESVSRFAVGGITAAAILDAFTPDLNAQQVAPDDRRIKAEYVSYPSPKGHEGMKGYLARPANPSGRLPAVIVIHGAAGPEKHFEDVTRRLALANFVGFMVDALSPLGGWAVSQSAPNNREKGNQMMVQLDAAKRTEDHIAAVSFLKTHPLTNGKVGVVGFCWGGGMVNTLAVRVPDLDAAVPYYGAQPSAADVTKIKAPLLIHYAGMDDRINAGWPAYEAALKAAGKTYTAYIYECAQHAFNNDADGPRYHK